jgi:hypothetical protein
MNLADIVMDHTAKIAEGLTVDELAVALGVANHILSPVVTRLAKGKMLFYTGVKRNTRTGVPARVYSVSGLCAYSTPPKRVKPGTLEADALVLKAGNKFLRRRSKAKTVKQRRLLVRTLLRELELIA